MAKPKLTRKQDTFVDAFIETGIGAEAARQAYDIKSPNEQDVAKSIATENLTKPYIQLAIADRLPDELLEGAHKSLLSQVRLDYFVFPKAMTDEEIKTHVEAQGLTVLNVRPSDKGKLAFFSLPDAHARGKGLELAYKLKGSFAAEKHLNVNLEVEATPAVQEAARVLNDYFRNKRPTGTGNGDNAGTVGDKAQG